MKINEGDEFKREFKKLLKKYQTLESDFLIARKVILAEPAGDGTKHRNVLWQDEERYIMKVRMMCRAVRGSSFRLVYLYDGESPEILFIEIYFKGNKELEDRGRIRDIVKKLQG